MNIQVRNVPAGVHKELKRRAKGEGKSLSEYVNGLFSKHVALPTEREWLEQLQKDEPIDLGMPAADLVREAREEEERELARKLGWED